MALPDEPSETYEAITEASNNTVTFNGNGSMDWRKAHFRNLNMKQVGVTYHPTIAQYYVLFSQMVSRMKSTGKNITNYYVLCPLYQNSSNGRWLDVFDYQLAVTGTLMKSELASIGSAMRREVVEELNINTDIEPLDGDYQLPAYNFGWGIANNNTAPVLNYDHDGSDAPKEVLKKQVIVAILEEISEVDNSRVNNHFHCEDDIVGFVRIKLTDVLERLTTDIDLKINIEENKQFKPKLQRMADQYRGGLTI